MVDITHKAVTLRTAIAQARIVLSKKETLEAIEQGRVPKGDVFEMSKAAGLLGVKKTPDLLPDCHPIPIEATSISYEINDLENENTDNVKTKYNTGVEKKDMHGARDDAIKIYDMIKQLEKCNEIKTIKKNQKSQDKKEIKKRKT